jgi:membrane-associated phospholipid phosphatase
MRTLTLAQQGYLRPVDHVFAFGNLAFAGLWSTLGAGLPGWPVWVMAHVLGAFLPLGWTLLPEPSRPGMIVLREIYALFGIAVFWTEIGILNRARPEAAFHDAWVRNLDHRLFGRHLHETWKSAVPESWFATSMDVLYLGYYLLVFGLPIVLVLMRHRHAVQDAARRLLATYVGCDLLYALFPVHGPRFALGPGAGTGTWLASVEDSLRAAGDSPGTAFPSSHVAGVLTAALLARRWLPRPIANVWLLGAFGVAASTIYTQNHYAVDVLGGAVWALVLWRLMSGQTPREKEAQLGLRLRFPRLHPHLVDARAARIALPGRMTS